MVEVPFKVALIVPALKLPEASRSTSVPGEFRFVPVVCVLDSVPVVMLEAFRFVRPVPEPENKAALRPEAKELAPATLMPPLAGGGVIEPMLSPTVTPSDGANVLLRTVRL